MGGWAGGAGGLAISVKTRNALAFLDSGSQHSPRDISFLISHRLIVFQHRRACDRFQPKGNYTSFDGATYAGCIFWRC